MLAASLTLALAAPAAATGIHFQSESLAALELQLGHRQVHALAFHPTPAPGHIHVSMNDGKHFTVIYAAGEQPHLLALASADGARAVVAVAKPKAAAKPVHHTLRYIAGGIVIVVIIVVAAVLLADRRRKLGEEASSSGDTPPTKSQPDQI